ncbi:chitin deacetylase [Legionella israelensis]|uniref:Chitin deacetylase n=1 Tax=Legionella israelensis TaxID=454 RepID=A0AAX1EIE2_9GAMM|nr:polysaccharide deacetylase family protein [Legionella israelensis]QBR84564.1 chitin deacetylase [Legionella israelensis]
MKRDMIGYGGKPPRIEWPNQAKLALNFVINYEEGAERSPLHNDKTAETYGGEFPLIAKPVGQRHLSMESLFEYGSRSGLWRLLRLFDQYHIPLTFFVTGFALTLNQPFCDYLRHSPHEIAGHGWRWIDYSNLSQKEEKEHMYLCLETIEHLTGQRPLGWYTGRTSEVTRKLLLDIGGVVYDSDSYADDLPYFIGKHLIIPYTLDCNDFRYTTSPGFTSPTDFFQHLKWTFDYLYQDNHLSMMTIALHPRISGRPGRCMAIKQFIDYIAQFQDIWIARRIDIANYWRENAPS